MGCKYNEGPLKEASNETNSLHMRGVAGLAGWQWLFIVSQHLLGQPAYAMYTYSFNADRRHLYSPRRNRFPTHIPRPSHQARLHPQSSLLYRARESNSLPARPER